MLMTVMSMTVVCLLPIDSPDTVASIEGPPRGLHGDLLPGLDEISEAMYERLAWLAEQSLDTTFTDQPPSLPLLTIGESKLLHQLTSAGPGQTTLERVKVVDVSLAEKVAPFVRGGASTADAWRAGYAWLRVRLMTASRRPPSADEMTYAGSPWKTYARCVLEPTRGIRASVQVEKDAGERYADGSVGGFLEFRLPAYLLIGDYTVAFGRGLLLGRAPVLGKGSDIVASAQQCAPGIHPSLSTSESGCFRGIAAEANAGPFALALFGSLRPRAATLTEEGWARSLSESDLFRTDTERSKKNAVHERVIGGRIGFARGDAVQAGINAYAAQFDVPLCPRYAGEPPESSFGGMSFDAMVDFKKVQFFGECAPGRAGGAAWAAGGTVQIGSSGEFVALVRRYPPTYHSVFAGGFGEGGTTSNETGVYAGCRLCPFPWMTIGWSVDRFRMLRRTHENQSAESGHDLVLMLEAHPSKFTTLILRLSERQSDAPARLTDAYGRQCRPTLTRFNHGVKAVALIDAAPRLTLRIRCSATRTGPPGNRSEEGFLLGGGIEYAPIPWCSIVAGMMLAGTDGYDSRVYDSEPQLPGVFGISPVYGENSRWCTLVSFSWAHPVRLSVRMAGSTREASGEIGGASMAPAGQSETLFGFQIDVRL
jgi:hypothetical protein